MGQKTIVTALMVIAIASVSVWRIDPAHGQTLIEQSTATGIASDRNGQSGVNGQNLINKAKDVAKEAGQRATEEAMQEPPASAGHAAPRSAAAVAPTFVTGNGLEAQFTKNPEQAQQALTGQRIAVRGVVAEVLSPEGQTLVIVRESGATKGQPAFMFRFEGKTPVGYKAGDQVELSGTFAFRHVDQQIGVTYVIDVDGGGEAANSPDTKTSFDDATKGWRYQGCVVARDGVTGVFWHAESGATTYARPGKKLADGVDVKKIELGQAVLQVNGKPLTVLP